MFDNFSLSLFSLSLSLPATNPAVIGHPWRLCAVCQQTHKQRVPQINTQLLFLYLSPSYPFFFFLSLGREMRGDDVRSSCRMWSRHRQEELEGLSSVSSPHLCLRDLSLSLLSLSAKDPHDQSVLGTVPKAWQRRRSNRSPWGCTKLGRGTT